MRFGNTVRLSERNGDLGKGILEIYKVNLKKWVPACVTNWNHHISPTVVCSLLGYNSVNSSRITTRDTNQTLTPSSTNGKDPNSIARMYQRKKTNLIKEFGSCSSNENHPVIDLTCSNYGKFVPSSGCSSSRSFSKARQRNSLLFMCKYVSGLCSHRVWKSA